MVMEYINPLQVLVKARQKIEKPENWTQHAFARNRSHQQVAPSSAMAVCFCSIGAIRAVTERQVFRAGGILEIEGMTSTSEAIDILSNVVYMQMEEARSTDQGIGTFNDENDHPVVLKAFDKAIEVAKTMYKLQG